MGDASPSFGPGRAAGGLRPPRGGCLPAAFRIEAGRRPRLLRVGRLPAPPPGTAPTLSAPRSAGMPPPKGRAHPPMGAAPRRRPPCGYGASRLPANGRRRPCGRGPACPVGTRFSRMRKLLTGMASASIRWPRGCGGTRNRAPPDKPVGHAAHGCGGPCVETLRKRAFLGMALSAEAPPSVSDVRGVMMRVLRGCEGTRSRPSCGIISERVSQVRGNHQKKRRHL